MSLVIANNVQSLTAQGNLRRTSSALGRSLERLSSGLKVNRGADGPAALVISEQQRAQIVGLKQAIQNSNKAVSLVQTAEGALGEINNLLTKIRSLAIDSANTGVNDDKALTANQAEITEALNTIDRIAKNTQFGKKKLLDGSASATATASNAGVASAAVTSATKAGTYAVEVTQAGTKGTQTAGVAQTSALALDETLTINGVDVALTAGDTRTEVIDKINAASDDTGVVADLSNGKIRFTSTEFGGAVNVRSNRAGTADQTGVGSLAGTGITVNSTNSNTVAGIYEVEVTTAGVKATQTAGVAQSSALALDETLTINGTDIALTAGDSQATVVQKINAESATTGGVADVDGSGNLRFTSTEFGGSVNVRSDRAGVADQTGVGATSDDTDVTVNSTTANTVAGTYAVEVTTAAAKATVTAGTAHAATLGQDEVLTFNINGGPDVTVDLTSGDDLTAVINKINTADIGIVASDDGSGNLQLDAADFGVAGNFTVVSDVAAAGGGTGVGTTTLTANNGADIAGTIDGDVATGLGATLTGNTGDADGLSVTISDAEAVSTGVKGNVTVTELDDTGVALEATINGVAATVSNATLTATTADDALGLSVTLSDALAGTLGVAGNVTVTELDDTGIAIEGTIDGEAATVEGSVLTSATGNSTGLAVTLSDAAAQAIGTYGDVTVDTGLVFQIGANRDQTVSISVNDTQAASLGTGIEGNLFASLAEIDVTTALGAQDALDVIDQAIDEVTTLRGRLGAFQSNTLESGANNLQATLENSVNAESVIRDTDFAEEVANLTKQQILQQAGVSVLANANQSPQLVLSLLGR